MSNNKLSNRPTKTDLSTIDRSLFDRQNPETHFFHPQAMISHNQPKKIAIVRRVPSETSLSDGTQGRPDTITPCEPSLMQDLDKAMESIRAAER